MATLTGETVSAQTVSRIAQELDQAVREFHQTRFSDEYAYLFLDGVSLRMRRPAGRKRVHMLVAYGILRDGKRHLLAFMRSKGENQAEWEGLLQDLNRRGLEGKNLLLIVTDGCPGLGAAIQTVYPRARHQRCWVYKMRNILEHVRKCTPRRRRSVPGITEWGFVLTSQSSFSTGLPGIASRLTTC